LYVHEFEIDSPLTSEPITVKVDYEWKPSRCEKCHIFGHSCPIPPPPQLNKGKLPVTDTIPIPTPVFVQPQKQPSTSALPIPIPPKAISSLIPSPIPPLIDSYTQPLPSAPAEPVVAPLSPSLSTANAAPVVAPLSPPNIPPQNNPYLPLPTLEETMPNAVASTDLNTQHQPVLDTTTCLESKMASLQSHSESSSVMEASTAETASLPLSESHDESPNPSPKTVWKKKGGRRRKEARGLQWL